MMNFFSTTPTFSWEFLLRDSIWGIVVLFCVLIFHGGSINHVSMRFEKATRKNLSLKQYHRVFFHFYLAFVFFALIHLFEILIWALFIIGFNLITDPLKAILFAGSCYTTVGFEGNELPTGWKSLAFFISFTGLFSLAWTTSIMISMTNTYKEAWNKQYDPSADD
jgi:hypothetical protein